jgi:acetyltransferase-like isoleucine patch superfamily enzyme
MWQPAGRLLAHASRSPGEILDPATTLDELQLMGTDHYPMELWRLDRLQRAGLMALSAAVVDFYRAVRRDRVRFGHGVVASHRLVIRGPGMVEIGDHANLYAFAGGRTRLVVRKPGALIKIGRNAFLSSATLQADTLIEVGPDCLVSQAFILDTDMHSLAFDRRTNPDAPVRTRPVVLESNVWVARGAAILPGVRIGEGSVVAYGSVVTSDVPPGVLVAGNPARVIRSLE